MEVCSWREVYYNRDRFLVRFRKASFFTAEHAESAEKKRKRERITLCELGGEATLD